MPNPTANARAALDGYIKILAQFGDGLTIDDFRTDQIRRSQRTAWRVRAYIIVGSTGFLLLALVAIGLTTNQVGCGSDVLFAGFWALALGGLGAVASIFVHVLKLVPQATLRTSDEFEVIGRIILGCLFSTTLALTLTRQELAGFFAAMHTVKCTDAPDVKGLSGALLLLPFLAGYSIPLVLGLLEKIIRSIELTIGLDDRREVPRRRARR